jgi:hypothetical protein
MRLIFACAVALQAIAAGALAADPPKPPKGTIEAPLVEPGTELVPLSPIAFTPAGDWTSPVFYIPTAGCHPDCSSDPSHGNDYGDLRTIELRPHEAPPVSGFHFEYSNSRFAPGTPHGPGCVFDIFDPVQADPTGATWLVWSRSEECFVVFLLTRTLVPN